MADALLDDRRYNALRARYGYAVTGHKVQGGEWPAVFVAFEGRPEWRNEDGFRWIYTALTRASERLYLVNPPSFVPWSGMTESEGLPAFERRDPVLLVYDAEVALSSHDFAVIRLDAPQRPVRLRLVRHEVSLDLDLYCDVDGYILSSHPTRPAMKETAPLLVEVTAVLDAAGEEALRSRLDVRAASFDRHLRHLTTAHEITLDLLRVAPQLVYRLRRGGETATASFWSRKDGRMRTWNLHTGAAPGLADELRAWFLA